MCNKNIAPYVIYLTRVDLHSGRVHNRSVLRYITYGLDSVVVKSTLQNCIYYKNVSTKFHPGSSFLLYFKKPGSNSLLLVIYQVKVRYITYGFFDKP